MFKKSTSTLVVFCIFYATEIVVAQWNLPYLRPEVYDYSELYGSELTAYQTNNPDGYAIELARAWDYYKRTFILSNGLVNHSKWDPGASSVVGTNEAVSEGQGYGMLLAVLLNDQPTFNRIFEAANQHMWDNNRKSYFIWNWPSGGQGAASDADVDVGIALVFADELQKKGLWNTYNGPVSYAARAMDIIRSLRNNMTQNDFFLPGDNWGGDALNNLNPSYFATAWFKVFNAYQNEVDFTPVINKCYQVLAMGPHFNKGQAPDWITSTGGRGGRGGLGMGNDAIRTPYRIAMDALWFNDSRAIDYCRKTKGTLSNYATSPISVIGQMGLYDESGNLISGTAGSFHHVAMWSTGILGAKEATYSTPSLQGRTISQITGTAKEHFGDESLHDHQFYYNQSLAMLGFAAITGQFPNIYEDMQGDIQTGIELLQPLSANATTVFFPQTVTFTAVIESPAPWTLTLTGQASGFTKQFTGSGTNITADWTGEGFTQVELVVAELKVTGLKSQSNPNVLKYNLQVQGPFSGITFFQGQEQMSWSISFENIEVHLPHQTSRAVKLEIYSLSGRLVSSIPPSDNTDKTIFSLPPNIKEGLYFGILTFNASDGNGQAQLQRLLKPLVFYD